MLTFKQFLVTSLISTVAICGGITCKKCIDLRNDIKEMKPKIAKLNEEINELNKRVLDKLSEDSEYRTKLNKKYEEIEKDADILGGEFRGLKLGCNAAKNPVVASKFVLSKLPDNRLFNAIKNMLGLEELSQLNIALDNINNAYGNILYYINKIKKEPAEHDI